MPKSILKCAKCGRYTLKQTCDCSGKPLDPRPAKFSIEDKWGKFRRIAKKNDI
ncbi:ribosome biogenesis protein [Candidatus Woesearchaeota archaeon]|nr:ribosome biogenesis protein [Candidatus Woesearchaeota archaeon]